MIYITISGDDLEGKTTHPDMHMSVSSLPDLGTVLKAYQDMYGKCAMIYLVVVNPPE